MDDINITSEPANPPAKTPPQKRRKRRTAAQIARDKRKAAQVRDALAAQKAAQSGAPALSQEIQPVIEEKTPEPIGPSPAVLALQAQVVDLVNQRGNTRQRLTQAHTAYLTAQGAFQAMQSELQGIEQEVQYRIQLIAQLENRTPNNVISITTPGTGYAGGQMLNPGSLQGVSSEPSAQQIQAKAAVSHQQYATGLADDMRREIRGMM